MGFFRVRVRQTLSVADLFIICRSDKFVGTALVPTKLVGTVYLLLKQYKGVTIEADRHTKCTTKWWCAGGKIIKYMTGTPNLVPYHQYGT